MAAMALCSPVLERRYDKVIVSAVTPWAVAPPLLPEKAAAQLGAYFVHGTCRTPGEHLAPLRVVPVDAAAALTGPAAAPARVGPPAAATPLPLPAPPPVADPAPSPVPVSDEPAPAPPASPDWAPSLDETRLAATAPWSPLPVMATRAATSTRATNSTSGGANRRVWRTR